MEFPSSSQAMQEMNQVSKLGNLLVLVVTWELLGNSIYSFQTDGETLVH